MNMFSDNTAVVYMVFLLNYTTDSPEEEVRVFNTFYNTSCTVHTFVYIHPVMFVIVCALFACT